MKIRCEILTLNGEKLSEEIDAKSKEEALKTIEAKYRSFRSCEFYKISDKAEPEFLGRAKPLDELEQENECLVSKSDPEPAIERRSGWSSFLNVIGVASFIIALISVGYQEYPLALMAGISSLNSFFFGFLINVFTDIRWILFKVESLVRVNQSSETTD